MIFTVKFWFALFLIFTAAEAITVQLVSVWFAGGALVALLLTALNAPLWLQILGFVAVSALLLLFTRPVVKKLMKAKDSDTNLKRIVGHTVIITEKVDNDAQSGRCIVAGVSWSVRSANGEIIEKGEKVTVERVEGVKLIVRK